VEPVDYLRILKRRWVAVALAMGVALWAAIIFDILVAPSKRATTYEAAQTLLMTQAGSNGTPSLAQAALLTTVGEVPRRAAAKLGATESSAQLAASVTATAQPDVSAIRISAKDHRGDRAAAIANTFSDELVAVVDQRAAANYQAQVDQVRTRLDQLKQRINALDSSLGAAAGGPVHDVNTAERDALVNQYRLAYDQFQQLAAQGPPSSAFTTLEGASPLAVHPGGLRPPNRPARIAFAVVLGSVLGIGLAFLLERLDTSLRTKDLAEEAFGLPVIAEIPLLPRRQRDLVSLHSGPRSTTAYAEAHRALRTILLVTRPGVGADANGPAGKRALEYDVGASSAGVPVILLSSPGPAEGKTTTVAQLAVAIAETGREVLILDGDIRRPRIHTVFGVAGGPGIHEVLTGQSSLDDVIVDTAVPGVRVVPAGAHPARSVGMTRALSPDLLDRARRRADVVLIDSGPLLLAPDATELAISVDGVVLTCRAAKTTKDAAARTAELLERVEAPVIGVVLVGAPEAPLTAYYYRYYLAHPRAEQAHVGSPNGPQTTPVGASRQPAAGEGGAPPRPS